MQNKQTHACIVCVIKYTFSPSYNNRNAAYCDITKYSVKPTIADAAGQQANPNPKPNAAGQQAKPNPKLNAAGQQAKPPPVQSTGSFQFPKLKTWYESTQPTYKKQHNLNMPEMCKCPTKDYYENNLNLGFACLPPRKLFASWVLNDLMIVLRKTCGDKNGDGKKAVAVKCNSRKYSAKPMTTTCQACTDDGNECCSMYSCICLFDDISLGLSHGTAIAINTAC